MISLRRPSQAAIDRHRADRLGVEPTCALAASPPPGFHHERFSRDIGSIGSPFTRQLQRRASNAYLDALATWVRTH